MKLFKGTKGKWEVNEYHEGDLIGISVKSNFDGSKLFDTGSCGYIDDEELANARLIANAPEMLEMLERIINSEDLGIEDYFEIEDLIKKIL